jgi:hypothetical protein
MAISKVDESQRTAAKVAGFLYLFTMAAANFVEFYMRRRVIVPGDAVQTARNIAASGQLFRLVIAGDLLILAAGVMLAVALDVILKPINRGLALLAVFWRLVECSVVAVTVANNFAALLLLSGVDSRAFSAEQLPAVARLCISMDTAGNRIGAVLFGLSSAVFAWLWFKSRYVPRLLAAFGILASLVPILVPFSTIVLPAMAAVRLRRARTGIPIVIFEVILGFWLLIKGVHAPVSAESRGPSGLSSSAT